MLGSAKLLEVVQLQIAKSIHRQEFVKRSWDVSVLINKLQGELNLT
jgi:hypothetical protein